MKNDEEHTVCIFQKKEIRSVWNEREQRWMYSVTDVIGALTESENPRKYWNVLKAQLKAKGNETDNFIQLKLFATDGKMRLTDVADADRLLDLIAHIPNKNTEPFKKWLSEIESRTDPAIGRAFMTNGVRDHVRSNPENNDPDIKYGVSAPWNYKGEIVLYHADDSLELEVMLDDETVWLSQAQMAELFQTERSNVTKHINNVFDERELNENSTCEDYSHIAANGKGYKIRYYNLDVIISVGYRVKSLRGTQFRIWATKVLREYLMKGHAIDRRFERIERRVTEAEEKIDFFVKRSLPPVQGIFHEGEIFDAHKFVSDLVRSAKASIIMIDNYADHTLLALLSDRAPGVTADIYTRKMSPKLKLDTEKHNAQYERIGMHETDSVHDRFLIIDGTVYHVGASFKDLGKKLFAFSRMEMEVEKIMRDI